MKITNRMNYPEQVVNAIVNDGYDMNANDLSKISTTTLISPPRIRMLKARHWDEIEEDVSDRSWAFLGSACHAMAERASENPLCILDRFISCIKGLSDCKIWSTCIVILEQVRARVLEFASTYSEFAITEQRYSYLFEGKTVSGKIDLFDKKEGSLDDWKVTSVYTVIYNPKGKEEWIQQANVNAFLMRKSGIEARKARIYAFLRDWNKKDMLNNKYGNYPKSNIVIIELPLWSAPEQLEYINARVRIHKQAECLAGEDLPLCTKEERWPKETTYALMKDGGKRAIKVFQENEKELAEIALKEKGKGHFIATRPGADTRCDSYCSVAIFCSYKNKGNTVDLFDL